MAELVARLRSLHPTVNEICRVSGTPGASIGVLYQGKVVYTQGFGYRDVEKKLVPDQDTIYYLASLSKAITGFAVGILVDESKLQWTMPIRKVVNGFSQDDATVEKESNLIDWLAHRTGLAPKNSMWSQEYGHASLKRKAALPMISYLEKVFEFRKQWLYSNWGWALADEVVETVSGESWGSFLKERIFDPLGMQRSITDHDTDLDNVAEAYMAMSDGTPYHLPRPFPEDGKVMEGAVAVQSCVRDLLTVYRALMEAADDQISNGTTSTPGNPLKQVPTLLQAHIPLSPNHNSPERSYAIGWVRAELPTTLGAIGLNPSYVGKMPTVGKGIEGSQMCLYHQGSTNTFLSSVHLMPKNHTAIVVLTNSMANNDVADWLGEMYLEAVLDNSDKNNYLQLAKSSATESLRRWDSMRKELERNRAPNTGMRPIDAYCGDYFNRVGTFSINIFQEGDKLKLCFQNDRSCAYDLEHYHYDTFSWLLTRDEDVRYGRFPVTRSSFYLLAFSASQVGSDLDCVTWVNDPAVPDGEKFWTQRTLNHQVSEEARIDGPG